MCWSTRARLTITRNCFALWEFGPCMGCLHGANRHEALRFPARLDDDMAAEHPVRCLAAFVDHLNRTRLGCQRAPPAATGRPAYAPAARLTLSLDGALSH